MKGLEKLRYSLKTHFGRCNAQRETMSVRLVTAKKYYWFDICNKVTIFNKETSSLLTQCLNLNKYRII